MTAPWCKALAMCRKRFARAFLGQESVEEGALVVLPLGEASEQPLRPSSTLENPREAPHWWAPLALRSSAWSDSSWLSLRLGRAERLRALSDLPVQALLWLRQGRERLGTASSSGSV